MAPSPRLHGRSHRLFPLSLTSSTSHTHSLTPQPHDLNRLNVVHIAGTKGKGSTSSFTSSILNQYRLSPTHTLSPTKIGLYTSPHLTSVRERIRLNDVPISEPAFAAAFFHVWKALGLDSAEPFVDRPTYFRLLTLLSFHVFMSEGVDAAVYEVGVGGEYDATNVFEKVVAAGIVSLGIDHVGVLGGTLGEIAWHKAGIMKSGCPAFTVPQEDAAMRVLKERAGEKGVDLVEVGVHPGLADVRLRPDEEFQRKNASLAIRLAATVMERFGTKVDVSGETLPREVVDGIEKCSWRGRCETIVGDKQTWYLDGAHNEQSLDVACRWFGRVSKERYLSLDLFPCFSLLWKVLMRPLLQGHAIRSDIQSAIRQRRSQDAQRHTRSPLQIQHGHQVRHVLYKHHLQEQLY